MNLQAYAVAKAVGEGVIAGLECYRYVYRLKFGKEPPMYAFYPIHDREGKPSYFEIPELKVEYRPKLLGKYDIEGDKIKFPETEIPYNEINEAILSLTDGKHEVKSIVSEISRNFGLDEKEAKESLKELVEHLILAKDMTIHV